MIRFVHFFNYATGVSIDEGEAWYLDQHVPKVKKLPGVVHYRSWPGIDPGVPYPSTGAPTPFDQFVRRTELCFHDLESALDAVMSQPVLWTPSLEGEPGFGEFECFFITEEAEFNLLRDAPQQHYKYMTLPLMWPKGRPEVDEEAEIFINCYCLAYKPKITTTDGEDWYLGHHTREGKQAPGMKHYRTWKTIRVPETTGSPLNPNTWYRMTELGMSPETYHTVLVNKETRIRFTLSPVGDVIGKWLNIGIKLELVEDFLA